MNLQDAAAQADRLIEDVKEENSRLSRELVEIRSYSETLHRDFTSLRDAAKQALDERDYYMRECAELRGKFTAFCAMATEALQTHSMAPFRPNGAPPKDTNNGSDRHESDQPTEGMMEALQNTNMDNGEPIPQFLHTIPEQAKIEGPLRLKRRTTQ